MARAAVWSMMLLGGCGPGFPPVADRLPGDHAFKARIARLHPPGSPAGPLRDKLAREGFVLLSDDRARAYSAILAPANIPCGSHVRIDWTEDRRGRVARIQAQRHDCS